MLDTGYWILDTGKAPSLRGADEFNDYGRIWSDEAICPHMKGVKQGDNGCFGFQWYLTSASGRELPVLADCFTP